MSVIQIYYAWILRQFSQLNKLFFPTEVIVLITSLCKPKFKFIEENPSRQFTKDKCITIPGHLDITQNLISGYFKSKPGLRYRQTPQNRFSTNIFNDSTLRKFF